MADYYVRSGATGSANGSSWANAYTTLASAISGKAAGDRFFVSEDHAESSVSAISLTFPGTAANPNLVYCVDHTGSVPPVSSDLRATAVIATSAASDITLSGAFDIHGVQFKPASSGRFIHGGTGGLMRMRSCLIAPQGSGAIFIGRNDHRAVLDNCDISFGSTAGFVIFGGQVDMTGGSVGATGSLPTTPFNANASGSPFLARLAGVDLSAFGTGKTLLGYSSPGYAGRLIFNRCKLGSGVTPSSTPPTGGSVSLDLVNCDSGATNYRSERYRYEGALTTETTIVRSGGATDGTTPVSHKIVTTANAKWSQPFENFPLAIWNDTVGSPVTVTVYGVWGSGSAPNNDDIWIDAEYLGDSASPKSSIATSGKADGLASNSALSSDASTWGGSTTAFKMTVTFTPQQKGLINVVVKAAAASTTFYIDPKPVLS